ncbi:uncharacterized protein LOC126971265 [Leptidea sinapis]|uniref:uncharacterized protein LOC126971265 n=1 Tax=Leptidea sinapis TaxID=189913 RepID=UPI00212D0A99|nr:uncharacterized protein LOC126971265 [Leptidea sinapis]
MESFIEAVRMHPCLWNPLTPDYREAIMKEKAWQHVIEHCNNKAIKNISIAKMEWKKLRDNHRDALKRAKLGKNKLLPAQITTWKYAKLMQFLEPHMKYRITEHIETDTGLTPSNDNLETFNTTTKSNNSTCSSPSTKRKRTEDSENALQLFFNCMYQSTKIMPSWMQTEVKKRIFNTIIDAEERLGNNHSDEKNNSKEQYLEEKYDSKEKYLVPTDAFIKTEAFSDDSCCGN